ncbi:MAG: hypothetical protein J0M08_13465 [Bacteroidetes bacterium]|nr:hypothetical protein [Bacteroidota bacterium]
MKKNIFALLLLFVCTYKTYAQVPFSREQLIGTWEIDYGTGKICDNMNLKPTQGKGRIVITFIDSLQFELLIEKVASTGHYQIDPVQGDIIFITLTTSNNKPPGESRNKVLFIDEKKLTLLIGDCGTLYEQNFHKVNSKYKK